jgi:uncharacterized protein (DUF302 family)
MPEWWIFRENAEIQTDRMSNGIVNEPSNHSVDETVDRLKTIVQASGAVLFRLVDHSGEVEKVGLEMKPTKLLIYGDPKAGTPLNLASPSPSTQDAGLGRCRKESVDFQQPRTC